MYGLANSRAGAIRVTILSVHCSYPNILDILDGLGDTIANSELLGQASWKEIIPKYALQGHHQHFIRDDDVLKVGKVNYVRLTIYPDGGISRMILMGHIIKGGD